MKADQIFVDVQVSTFELEEFLQLLNDGGAIISSNECTPGEIAEAQADGRFYADSEGYGYIYDPLH